MRRPRGNAAARAVECAVECAVGSAAMGEACRVGVPDRADVAVLWITLAPFAFYLAYRGIPGQRSPWYSTEEEVKRPGAGAP
ncbi:hypothetical protein GCM10009672_03360 [Nesterenkonia lutea]